MGILLITGPVGSGKTEKAVDEFASALRADPADAVTSMRYIVPTTRAAREIENRIMEFTGLSGIMGNIVSTFYGFTGDVLAEQGLSGALVSDTQRLILLKEFVNAADLEYFGNSALYPGFVQALGQIIGELKVSMVTPEELENAFHRSRDEIGQISGSKICELINLYREYQDNVLVRNSLHDREGLMWRALEIIKQEDAISRLKHVVFDGFEDFSGVQKEFLRTISRSVDNVVVTLAFDPERPEVFDASRADRDFVLGLGASEEQGGQRLDGPDSLRHLEASLFKSNPEQIDADESLSILEGGNPLMEVETIAEELRRLVRNHGYGFGDTAIIGRNIDSYRVLIERTFPRYEIPLDISRRSLAGTAVARTLAGCISVVRTGWQRPDIVRLLKSEFLGVGEEAVRNACCTEVEAKQTGIFDTRDKWLARLSENDSLLDFRVQSLSPVVEFETALSQAAGVSEYAKATIKLMESFRLRKQNDMLFAEDSTARRTIVELLEDLVKAEELLARRVDRDEFLDLLQTVINCANCSIPHVATDAVSLLSPSELGGQKFKVVFVIGLLEKVFPKQILENSFLRDRERRLLNEHMSGSLLLASDQQEAERKVFYITVSSAVKRLYLCYPLADEAAKDSLPSFYVDEVRKLFRTPIPTIRKDISDLIPPIDQVESPLCLKRSLSHIMSHATDVLTDDILGIYLSLPEADVAKLRDAFASAQERDASISCDPLLKRLASADKVYRCTELESYAACCFMHHCGHTLRLEPIREEVGALDYGSILHQVLYKLLTTLRDQNGGPVALHEPEVDVVLTLAGQIFDSEFERSSRLQNLPLHEKDIARRNMWTWLKRYIRFERRNSYPGFKPQYFELQFGRSAAGVADRYRDPLSTEQVLNITFDGEPPVRLSGTMDRLDVSDDGALIIDYKLGAGANIKNFEEGILLQAMIYAIAAKELFGLHPVAAEYRSLKKWSPSGYYVDHAGIGSKNSRLSDGEFCAKLEQCKEYVRTIVSDLRSGKIQIKPRDCKSYCPFKPICRIDGHKLLAIKQELSAQVESEDVSA